MNESNHKMKANRKQIRVKVTASNLTTS